MRILITNDDGLSSRGCQSLEKELATMAEVWVIAPDRERSATSQAFSLRDTLRLVQVQDRHYTVNGFPADCVNVALFSGRFPSFDLVVSGINHGINMGEDIHYSGTVGAARHAAIHRVRALAASTDLRDKFADFSLVARELAGFLEQNWQRLRPGICYSMNIPSNTPLRGYKAVPLGRRSYFDAYRTIEKNETEEILVLNETPPGYWTHADTDFDYFERGYATITPLGLDSADRSELEDWRKIEPTRS